MAFVVVTDGDQERAQQILCHYDHDLNKQLDLQEFNRLVDAIVPVSERDGQPGVVKKRLKLVRISI